MESNNSQLSAKPTQTIPQYFTGKNVLVTGATGFMGKVLVEKLLRSCPNIGNIYILIRNKRGVDVQERWNKAVDCELFNLLKETNQEALDKVKVMKGDVSELELGLSAEDRQELINNVSIVYHTAATVRFNESLKQAILLNTRGTKEICNLVLEMKKVITFLHVSTAYCQIGNDPLEEKMYPARGNPIKAIQLAETMDEISLKLITSKYCESFPNTYTFTKCLAETLVKNMCENKIPTIIFRPTIVTPTMKDPFPGWLVNFNGPIGLSFGVSKGLVRTLNFKGEKIMDFMPVDSAISAIIKSTWLQPFIHDKNISVYNCSSSKIFNYTQETLQQGMDFIEKSEIWCKPLFVPNLYKTTSSLLYWIHVYIFQLIPALFVDTIFKIARKKPMLLFIQAKLLSAFTAVLPFNKKTWKFNNNNFIDLDKHLMDDDVEAFGNKMDALNVWDYMYSNFLTLLKLAKEDKDPKKNYRNFQRLKYVYYIWNTTLLSIIGLYAYNNIIIPLIHDFLI